jgi:hypothetical protein
MKNLSQDNWCPSWSSNQPPPQHKSEALPLEPSCLIRHINIYYIVLWIKNVIFLNET